MNKKILSLALAITLVVACAMVNKQIESLKYTNRLLISQNASLKANIDDLSEVIAEHELSITQLEKSVKAYHENVDDFGNDLDQIKAFMYKKFMFEVQ